MSDESVTVTIQMTGNEAIDAQYHPAGLNSDARILTHDGFNVQETFDVNSLVLKPTHIIPFALTIGASATTLDLTAINQALEREVDLEGKKLFQLLLVAPSTNSDPVTVGPGDSNPYPPFGDGNEVDLGAGEFIAKGETSQFNNPAVEDTTAQNIKISGTEGDKLNGLMYFGETPS